MVKIKKRNYSLKGFSKFRNKKIKTRKQNIKRGGMVNNGDGDEYEHYVGIINEVQAIITNLINDYNHIMDMQLIAEDNNIIREVTDRETPYQYEDVEMVNQTLLILENRMEELGNLSRNLYRNIIDIERTLRNNRSYLDTLNQQISRVEKGLSSVDYFLSERGRLLEEEKKKYLSDRQLLLSEREKLTRNQHLKSFSVRRDEEWLEELKHREREVDEHLHSLNEVKYKLKELLPKPEPEPEPEPTPNPRPGTRGGDDDSQNGGKKNKKNKKNKRKKSIKRKGKKV